MPDAPMTEAALAEIEARCDADGSWNYGGMIGDPGKMLAHFVVNEAGKPLFFSDLFSVDYTSLDLPLKAAVAAVADRAALIAALRRSWAENADLKAKVQQLQRDLVDAQIASGEWNP